MTFSPSRPEQMEDIASLLQKAFRVSSDDPLLDRAYLRWKYFADDPSSKAPRSYVLSSGSEIVAHAAVWPLLLRTAGGVREGISFGDWVAAEGNPGAGLLMLRHIMELASFVVVTGGAPVTRAILPRTGFQPWAQRTRYSRVLRPVRQAFSRSDGLGWKEPARLVRNSLWSLRPLAPAHAWTAERATPTPELVAAAQSRPGTLFTADDLLYRLACPAVGFHFFALRDGSTPRGYGVIGFADGQARIADLRLGTADQADWDAALGALVRAAGANAEAVEAVLLSSTPSLDSACVANGFLPRGVYPLVVYDRDAPAGGGLSAEPVPQLGMLEDDAASMRYVNGGLTT